MADAIGYFQYLLAGLVLIAAAIDSQRFQIPNWIPLTVIIAFLFAASLGSTQTYWMGHAIAGLLTLAVGLAAFKYRVMGGGDVKLIAAIALCIGMPNVFVLLASIGIAGGILALFIMMARSASNLWLTPQTAESAQSLLPMLRANAPAPYGIAIAAGTLFTLFAL